MYIRVITIAMMLLTTHIWALNCSNPITVSDTRFDASQAKVFANETGDAAVIWIAEQSRKEALMVSCKTPDTTWSSYEIVSGLEKDIYKHHGFINQSGELFVTWKADRKDGAIIQMAEKRIEKSWTTPLDWENSHSDFNYRKVGFEPPNKLIFVGETSTKYRTKPAYPGGYSYESTLPGIAIVTKSPFRAAYMTDDYTMVEGIYSVNDLTLASNKNGDMYVFWVTHSSDAKALMGRKIQYGRFISAPETICQLDKYVYEMKASINEKGDVAIAYRDANGKSSVILKFEDAWSEPFSFTEKSEEPYALQVTIDSIGNVMAVSGVEMDDDQLMKVVYKPFGQSWLDPVQFSVPNADNWSPKIQPDGNGNFVLVWEQSTRSRTSIFGATFSTTTLNWSEPQLLSPKEVPCYSFSFTFWAPGKGYISWTTRPNGFDESVQVAELTN